MGYFDKIAGRLAPPSAAPEKSAMVNDWGYSARRDLLEQITDFLLRYDLDVTPRNLATAHSVLSGSNLELARKVSQRQVLGLEITQDWLDSLLPPEADHEKERDSIDHMMDTLQATMSGFARTTKDASSETGQYSDQMREHVAQVEQRGGGMDAERFIKLSSAMLGTLQRIETSVQRSQSETVFLQAQLEKARKEADCDHLTGLPNRRAFERTLQQLHSEAESDGKPLFLAICDVDHFKRINDTFGHETGDRLLRAIGGVLQRFTTKDCFVARHGGEEFVILISDVSMPEAYDRLEVARKELANRKFVARHDKRPIGQVTFSAGLADVFATANPRDALTAADAALYRAKEEGRNRVMIA